MNATPKGEKSKKRSVATSAVGVKSDSEILDNFRLPATGYRCYGVPLSSVRTIEVFSSKHT